MQKIQIAAVSIMLAMVALIAGGTAAYFTAQTETVSDVYTIGDVEVTFDEGSYNAGTTDTNTRVSSNNFGSLGIGEKVDVDPTIHVSQNSKKSWLAMSEESSKWKTMAMMFIVLNPLYLQDHGLTNVTANNVQDLPDAVVEQFVKDVINTYYTDFNWDSFVIMNMPEIKIAIAKALDRTQTDDVYLRIDFASKTPVEGGTSIPLYSGIQIPANIAQVPLQTRKVGVPNFNMGSYKMKIVVGSIQSDNLSALDEPGQEPPSEEEKMENDRQIAYYLLKDSLDSKLSGVEVEG